MSKRAVVLVDGEHYPPVTLDAIDALRSTYEVVAAVFAGGGEKLDGPLQLGALPVVRADAPSPDARPEAGTRLRTALRALQRALDEFSPDVVVDCSDAPVVDARSRSILAAVALAHGATYEGADFEFRPPVRPRLANAPAIAVIGTGKRTGKTAIAAALARYVTAKGKRAVIVAMGRGGPADPVVTRGAEIELDARELLRRADAGEHAATDAYEDAITARTTTVGARRAGAGFYGATLHDTVARAVEAANAESPDVVILEGSGTAIPPAHAGATILVASSAHAANATRAAASNAARMDDGALAYRLLISDLVVVTMPEEPVGTTETIPAFETLLADLARNVPVKTTVLRPTPLGDVAGRKIFFATTAPPDAGPALCEHLERAHGAIVIGRSHNLADRPSLANDLNAAEGTYEMLVTEVKAAAIDVAARAALKAGADVVFADNRPGGLDADFETICRRAGV